jgi:ech hydrogenase subunit A
MVKAGVFLLIRLAPALAGKFIGDMVALVGILTFMTSAFIAVSQRNSKRVLALSTVSNLGLIVVCAGIGTPQLMWAAFFLILFHAIAKALLFLGVGTVSIGTGSLDIEEMGGLVVTMPRVAVLLVIGIAGMFVAPFGMLISKWTAMEALISLKSMISPILITALAFGSATTVFFWTKWLGTIIRVSDPTEPRGLQETRTTIPERFAELSLALLAMLSFLSFSLVSRFMAEPFLRSSFAGEGFSLGSDNVIIASLMVAMTILLPALTLFVASRRHTVLSGAYMSGRSSEAGLVFKGSAGIERKVDLRAYYLEKFFAERRLLPAGIGIGILMLIIMFGTVLL